MAARDLSLIIQNAFSGLGEGLGGVQERREKVPETLLNLEALKQRQDQIQTAKRRVKVAEEQATLEQEEAERTIVAEDARKTALDELAASSPMMEKLVGIMRAFPKSGVPGSVVGQFLGLAEDTTTDILNFKQAKKEKPNLTFEQFLDSQKTTTTRTPNTVLEFLFARSADGGSFGGTFEDFVKLRKGGREGIDLLNLTPEGLEALGTIMDNL